MKQKKVECTEASLHRTGTQQSLAAERLTSLLFAGKGVGDVPLCEPRSDVKAQEALA